MMITHPCLRPPALVQMSSGLFTCRTGAVIPPDKYPVVNHETACTATDKGDYI